VRAKPHLLLYPAAGLTALLVLHTYWYLYQSFTNVPFWDQWLLIDEIRRFREGGAGWSWLWTPYWGQRPFVFRLVLLATDRFFRLSNLPLVLVSAAAQLSMPAVLAAAAGSLFPASRRLAALCAIASAHLLLSSLQMEVLFPASVNHALGYASATAALIVFPRHRMAGILLAVFCTGCLATGLLLFPAFAVEAWISRARAKTFAALLATAAILASLYSIGYTRPAMGMGIGGALRHPVQALKIIALVLGGPVTLFSGPLGIVTGAVGLAAAFCFAARHLRRGSPSSAARSLTLLACFIAATAVSLAVGRYSPDWLAAMHGSQVLPGRYLLPAFLFWSALFALALNAGRAATAVVSVVVLAMSFGTWPWQWRVSREWAQYFQRSDAIASGFLLGVSDQARMGAVMPDDAVRNRVVEYLRRNRLAIFAEPRARWIGRGIAEIRKPAGNCFAAATAELVEGNAGAVGVSGTLPVNARDVLIANESGTVIGLGRSMPAQSESGDPLEFFGYARASQPAGMRLFALPPGGPACDATPQSGF